MGESVTVVGAELRPGHGPWLDRGLPKAGVPAARVTSLSSLMMTMLNYGKDSSPPSVSPVEDAGTGRLFGMEKPTHKQAVAVSRMALAFRRKCLAC